MATQSDQIGNVGSAGNANVYRIVSASGNPLIDGVLSGVAWKYTNFSVSYPTSGLSYGFNYGNGENATFSPFNSAQKAVADFARSLIAEYTPVTFVAGTEGSANLRYGNFQTSSLTNTHGYYPDGTASMGDMWYGPANNDQGIGTIGTFAFATILHEQGHTFGLKHGSDVGINGGVAKTVDNTVIPNYAPLPAANDDWNYTVMSYRAYQGATLDPIQGNLTSDNPVTYMMADIAALQYMYGANFSGYSSTNTLYQWDASGNKYVNGSLFLPAAVNGKIFESIWDGGGVDTYDTSNFTTSQNIDLRPGAFSTIDKTKIADLDRFHPGTHMALGNVANALLYQGDLRSLIENAVTGSGADVITGNQANNFLSGNGGADTISGDVGNDTLNGGSGNDSLNGGAGIDIAMFSGASTNYSIVRSAGGVVTVTDTRSGSPDGTDTLRSIERLQFSDKTTVVMMPARDFNGEGHSDILFRNAAGVTYLWTMSSASVSNGATTSVQVGNNWKIKAVADFDGGGAIDILWVYSNAANVSDPLNGVSYISFQNGASATGGGVVQQLSSVWQVVGAGDFNGDGLADVLYRSSSTGQAYLDIMNGSSVNWAASGFTSQQVTNANWHVAGVADFNADGNADVLWRYSNAANASDALNGTLYEWTLNGTNVTSGGLLSQQAGAVWQVAGTGDFNGDGSADILFRNSTSGQTYIDFMNGTQVTSGAPTQWQIDNSWAVASIGDFNADGRSDILFQQTSSGNTYIWTMNGANVTAGAATSQQAGFGWTVQNGVLIG